MRRRLHSAAPAVVAAAVAGAGVVEATATFMAFMDPATTKARRSRFHRWWVVVGVVEDVVGGERGRAVARSRAGGMSAPRREASRG